MDVDKDKMTLTITNGDNTNPNTQTWELEVVGKLQQDVSKGWWTQGGIIMSMQNLKVIEAAYNKMAKIKDTNSSYDQVYVKVDDLKMWAMWKKPSMTWAFRAPGPRTSSGRTCRSKSSAAR